MNAVTVRSGLKRDCTRLTLTRSTSVRQTAVLCVRVARRKMCVSGAKRPSRFMQIATEGAPSPGSPPIDSATSETGRGARYLCSSRANNTAARSSLALRNATHNSLMAAVKDLLGHEVTYCTLTKLCHQPTGAPPAVARWPGSLEILPITTRT